VELRAQRLDLKLEVYRFDARFDALVHVHVRS
jgi:hypothetical protein